jgi:mono/diheme cytochrome c family protein
MLTSLTRNTVVLLVLTYLGSAYLSPPTLAGPAAFEAQRPANTETGSRTAARALLDEYCITCHNERLNTGGLSLETLDLRAIRENAPVLERIVRKVRAGQMPPEGRPRPTATGLDTFAATLETALDEVAQTFPNPGRVASRRLNRLEYANAIEDLLALEINAEELLPSDMAGFGFDNNADVLSITPALMERYITAATKISRAAIGSPDNRPIRQAYQVGYERRDIRLNESMPFATHGGLAARHHFPLNGEYQFSVRLKRDETIETIDGIAEETHEIELRVDHELLQRFEIGGQFPGPDPGLLIAVPEDDIEGQRLHDYRMTADRALELRVPVDAGTRLVTVGFTDSAPSPETVGDQPGIDMLFISGPFDGQVPTDTPSRRRIFTCHPDQGFSGEADTCAREILSSLARRAYRRPVTTEEIEPLLTLYREGQREQDFDAGIERSLEALLAMPEFLFRLEQPPVDAAPGSVYRVSDLELASRLSFFLWKSLPDETLLALAESAELSYPAVLAEQIDRMLADPRATRFMNDFMGQWLQIRNIHSQDPDGALFAGFNDTLRRAMVRETELFFESQVRQDAPIPELLRADYTFLNEQLARHYGVNHVYGSRFRRVTWTDDRRHGLLGHASLLTVTSYANRTSVVLRGKWVLETLLGSPPPPPPPNVPPLEENDERNPTSLRDRMEQHRRSPVCASCHRRMDPLGFAMEHFDAIGRWRDADGGAAINATVTLAGTTIDSPRAFREALLREGDQEFLRTVTEKLLTYALGRGVDYYDAPTIRRIVRQLGNSEYRWSSLVQHIVTSEPFQQRRATGRRAAD